LTAGMSLILDSERNIKFEVLFPDFEYQIGMYKKSTEDLEFDKFLSQFSKEDHLENTKEELFEKEEHLKKECNEIVLYKNNNQFSYPSVLPSTEKEKTEKEDRLKKKEEFIIQLIQKNFTTKKFITKKIYVRENNSIYIFYFIITCAVIFTSLYR
jgi:sugar diacid utilization regulator